MVEILNLVKAPVTRKNYIDMAYLGTPPEEISAEEELQMPENLRKLPSQKTAPKDSSRIKPKSGALSSLSIKAKKAPKGKGFMK